MDRTKLRETITNTLKKYGVGISEEGIDELVAIFDAARLDLPAPTGDPVRDIGEWERISAMHFEREQAEQAMLLRLEKALGITPNGRPEWDKIARFLIEKENQGGPTQTIEAFAANCRLDPYTTPKQHQIAKDPMAIKMNWIHVMGIGAPKDYSASIGSPKYYDALPAEDLPEEAEKTAPLTEIEKAWQRALDQLQADMLKGTFDAWVRDTVPLSYQDGVFTVGAPIGALLWLENRLTSTATRLMCGILRADIKVRFVEVAP